MLLYLTKWLAQYDPSFNVFGYLTMRAILGALTALAICFVVGPLMIKHLRVRQIGEKVRDYGPETHLLKAGTPTMGGALIIIAVAISTLLWANLTNHYVWLVVGTMLAFGAIGFVDDYRKVVHKNSDGLIARWKYFWLSVAAISVAAFLYFTANSEGQTQLVVPFFKDVMPQLGLFFIIWTYFVIVGSSNAVNLTDGLDGLAIMPTVMVAAAFGIIAYLTGNVNFSSYLFIPHIPQASEVLVVCMAIVGAGLGFLWFNTYPAEIFMGDTGSLSLGAILAVIAIIVHQEILLILMGGIFVAETLSVIIQIGYFKRTQERFFLMAPIHHHFEKKGLKEPKIIVRFWIVTLILVLISLASIKIR